MALTIIVRVVPGTTRRRCILFGEGLKCFLTQPPERGRANEELIELIAHALGVGKQRVSIIAGEVVRNKKVLIDAQVSRDQLLHALGINIQRACIKEK